MTRKTFSRCKDCGTPEVIPIHKDSDLTEILCKDCLTFRAQIQSIKEDKLPFTKLLDKIRKETDRRVQNEIRNSYSPFEMLYNYKGHNGTVNHNYWTEQLKQA